MSGLFAEDTGGASSSTETHGLTLLGGGTGTLATGMEGTEFATVGDESTTGAAEFTTEETGGSTGITGAVTVTADGARSKETAGAAVGAGVADIETVVIEEAGESIGPELGGNENGIIVVGYIIEYGAE